MKKTLLLSFLTALPLLSFAQNTFPSVGRVGIGTTAPAEQLEVKGTSAFINRNGNNRLLIKEFTEPGGINLTGIVTGSQTGVMIKDRDMQGGLWLYGGHFSDNFAQRGAIGAGLQGDLGTFRATGNSFSWLRFLDGSIDMFTGSGLIPGNIFYGGTNRFKIDPTGRIAVNSPTQAAGQFFVRSTEFSIGLWAISSGTNTFSNAGGVYGPYTYGLIGEAEGGATFKAGVFGSSEVRDRSYAVYAQGKLTHTGGISSASDGKLKENVKGITNGLNVIMALKPREYTFKKEYAFMNLSKKKNAGFVAQELQPVLPHLVSEEVFPGRFDTTGKRKNEEMSYLSVDYMAVVPYLVAAVQDQQRIIDSLEASIKKMSSTEGGRRSLEESMSTGAALFQNKPNPFSETTTISYNLPNEFKTAAIYVYNMNGGQVGKFSLQKAQNSLKINGGTLKAGMYFYSLIIDEKEVDTKRMILTK